MEQRWKIFLLSFLVALSLGLALEPTPAPAVESILAVTAGNNNATDADFYAVLYVEGTSFIQSLTFDVTASGGGFFDFDGEGTFNDAILGPVFGTLVGLSPADITTIFSNLVPDISFPGGNPQHPATLTFDFAPGSFGPGDAFRFAADTDFVTGLTDQSGGVFGEAGATFSALLESGPLGSLPFMKINEFASVASIVACPCPAPLPGTVILFGSALIGLVGVGIRRKSS